MRILIGPVRHALHTDLGLLVLRVGLGLMMMGHGWPKLTGGPEKWAKLGGAMGSLGIDFAPTFWGFMASFSELVGGAMVAVGLLTRVHSGLLVCTMGVAAAMHLSNGDGVMGSSHAIEDGIAFLALVLLGAGRFSVDARVRSYSATHSS